MMQDLTTIPRAVHLLLIGRHLERMGDHASNIAEDVVYIVKGRIVRHRKEELSNV
jgi:phosphate transport system protein